MLLASEARARTNRITKRDLEYMRDVQLRKNVAYVMREAARVQLAAIQLKQYEAYVDVPNVRTMLAAEKKLVKLGYETCCAAGGLWIKFSWRRKRQTRTHHS